VSVDELLRVTSDGGGDVREAAALVARFAVAPSLFFLFFPFFLVPAAHVRPLLS
jgi:hypothetical protein